MVYSRQLSSTERAYVVYNECCPPFLNQFFWEGTGYFDLPKWKEAVKIASEANPGSRVVVKGIVAFARLVDTGKAPPVIEVDGSSWDGLGPEGAPARLRETLCPFEGPTSEVVLIHGNPLRIVFRTMHATMDGRGTVTWVEDIFRCLRGEAPLGADSRLTEFEIAATFQNQGRKGPLPEYIAPTGMPQGDQPGMTWRRRRYPGHYHNVIGQMATLLAKEAWRYQEGKVRLALPVDMRARVEGLRSTGNLTNLIYVAITPTTTPSDVSQDIKRQLEARHDGMIYWGDRPIRYLPLWTIRKLIKRDIATKNLTGRYPNSGVLSNLGHIPVYSGGGFEGKCTWAIPPGQEYSPIFIVMCNGDNEMTLIYSMSNVLANGGRLEALMDHIQQGLVASQADRTKG
ncbi:MAG: hypothetical protein WC491_06070 [Candidatus Omnitrophota bacterium]